MPAPCLAALSVGGSGSACAAAGPCWRPVRPRCAGRPGRLVAALRALSLAASRMAVKEASCCATPQPSTGQFPRRPRKQGYRPVMPPPSAAWVTKNVQDAVLILHVLSWHGQRGKLLSSVGHREEISPPAIGTTVIVVIIAPASIGRGIGRASVSQDQQPACEKCATPVQCTAVHRSHRPSPRAFRCGYHRP